MQPQPSVLTERDLLLLEALAEQRVAVIAQAAHWLGVSEPTAAQRVRRLRAAGLVESRRVFDRGSPMLRITAAGLKRIDSPLGKPGQKLDEYRHDVGVGWVWTAAREGVFGPLAEIHSERAMRSHDARLEPMSAGERLAHPEPVAVGGLLGGGREDRHYPDLLLESRAGPRIAVELELSSKGRRRLERVMAAYAADPRVDAVVYLVGDQRLGERIMQAAAEAGIADIVHVRRISPRGIGGVASAPDLTATRARGPVRNGRTRHAAAEAGR